MHTKKPDALPLMENKPRRLCPVCGMVSYSFGGIHPQCSQTQADAPRVERLNAARKAEKPKKKATAPDATSHWYKPCPKCHAQLHARKLICDCGHKFS